MADAKPAMWRRSQAARNGNVIVALATFYQRHNGIKRSSLEDIGVKAVVKILGGRKRKRNVVNVGGTT
jgi:hypothetical protein